MTINHNIIAERIVISGVMNNPDVIIDLQNLEPEHFYNSTHKILYYLLKKLYTTFKGEKVDPFTLLSTAKNENISFEKDIEKSGGVEYLQTLSDLGEDYSKNEVLIQAEIVTKLSFFRDMHDVLDKQLEYIENGDNKSREDVIDSLRQSTDKTISKYTISDNYNYIGSVYDDVMEKVRADVKNGEIGISSKIEPLNKFYTYRKGELVVLVGRAKSGKSAFSINEAHNMAIKKGIPTLYLDTEMQTRTFLMRLIAIDSGIPLHELETFQYELDPEKLKKYKESEKRIKKAPLIHKYSTHWTTKKVRNDVISLVRQEGIEMVIYDYIKVKEVNESRNKEHNELGNWTIALKDLAGEVNVPILTLAQMSPYEIRVADSDKINRYASVVGFLLPLSEDDKNRMKQWGYPKTKDYIYIKYNRNGASMEDEKKGVYLEFNRDNVTFKASEYQEKFEDLVL